MIHVSEEKDKTLKIPPACMINTFPRHNKEKEEIELGGAVDSAPSEKGEEASLFLEPFGTLGVKIPDQQ